MPIPPVKFSTPWGIIRFAATIALNHRVNDLLAGPTSGSLAEVRRRTVPAAGRRTPHTHRTPARIAETDRDFLLKEVNAQVTFNQPAEAVEEPRQP
jgi:hypothetical protein